MLKIENLSVVYERHGQTVQAVRGVSLAMDSAEIVGLVGESGSGKSTLALAILGLIRPQEGRIVSGRILFHGEDLLKISKDRLREIRGRQISMIFQDPFTSINPVMRIQEQMSEGLIAHGLAVKRSQLEEALGMVQLPPERVLTSYPHQLSGGERQRVLLATAILTKPELLLADEPTTALDVLVQKDILDLLFSVQRAMRWGMLFISHNLALVARYTQRTAVMKEGCLVEENASTDLFRQPRHAYTQSLVDALNRLC